MKKILETLLVASALPVLAQQPAAPAAPQARTAANSAVMDVVPVLEGDTKVTLTPGTFDQGNQHLSASSYVPLVGMFTGSAVAPLKAAGEFSESKAPANLKRILLNGYSPKALGLYGTPILCKCKVDDGNRVIKLKDVEVNKDYWKSLSKVARLTQNPDGQWLFEVQQPLERGHYLVTFLKSPMYYWDFDVK